MYLSLYLFCSNIYFIAYFKTLGEECKFLDLKKGPFVSVVPGRNSRM